MRKVTIIPYVVAAFVAGACGDKHSQSSDANAAEVTVSPEASSVSTPTGPAPAGTVTFDRNGRRIHVIAPEKAAS